MPDERRRLVVGRGRGNRLDPVLLREVVELVAGAPRLDQVRQQHRVLGGLHRQPRQRLEVVRDQLGPVEASLETRFPAADDDALILREGEAPVANRKSRACVHLRQLALAPFDLRSLHAHRLRRHGLVEDVHAAQQVTELEAAEHLA